LGLVSAGVRAIFGSASSFVDLASVSDYLRRGTGPAWVAILQGGACLLLLGLLALLLVRALASGRGPGRVAVAAFLGTLVPILLFGTWWNNSDDQFFFQVAPTAALLLAAGTVVAGWRWLPALLALPLLVNAGDLVVTYLTYPRAERVAALAGAIEGTSLVIAPGRDETFRLFSYSAGVRQPVLYISTLAETGSPDQGLRQVRDTVAAVLGRGGQVAAVNLAPSEASQQPWPMLHSLGYERDSVAAALGPVTVVRRVTVAPSVIVEVLTAAH
jgi:hypothetical protein